MTNTPGGGVSSHALVPMHFLFLMQRLAARGIRHPREEWMRSIVDALTRCRPYLQCGLHPEAMLSDMLARYTTLSFDEYYRFVGLPVDFATFLAVCSGGDLYVLSAGR